MQCKVLEFNTFVGYGGKNDYLSKMETELNRWLAEGWKIVSTTTRSDHGVLVFLTK